MPAPATPSLRDALTDLPRISQAGWRRLSWLRRYLIAVRAVVLPLTLCSCLFGGLLALPLTHLEGVRLGLATAALVLAHAASNLLNDQIAWALGAGRTGQAGMRYGTRPLVRGLMSPFSHALMLIVTATPALLLAAVVGSAAGPAAWWLAGIGLLLLMFHGWPLKRLGLSELAVFIVWGPLMTGGVYWLVSDDWGPEILLLSALFGLGPAMTVLGRHADQRAEDAARRVRTLAVRLGRRWGPRLVAALALLQMAGGLSWAWVTGSVGYLVLLTAVPALLSLLRVCLRSRPTARPPAYPVNVWPLWYGAAAFRYARTVGAALVAGALLDGI